MPHTLYVVQDQENKLEFEFDSKPEARRKLCELSDKGIIAYIYTAQYLA